MDFLELLAEEHCFREGGFSVLALLGLLKLPSTVMIPSGPGIFNWL
jgi:hypothetical protein